MVPVLYSFGTPAQTTVTTPACKDATDALHAGGQRGVEVEVLTA